MTASKIPTMLFKRDRNMKRKPGRTKKAVLKKVIPPIEDLSMVGGPSLAIHCELCDKPIAPGQASYCEEHCRRT